MNRNNVMLKRERQEEIRERERRMWKVEKQKISRKSTGDTKGKDIVKIYAFAH